MFAMQIDLLVKLYNVITVWAVNKLLFGLKNCFHDERYNFLFVIATELPGLSCVATCFSFNISGYLITS